MDLILSEIFTKIQVLPNKGSVFLEKVDYWYKRHAKNGSNYKPLKKGWEKLLVDLEQVYRILKEENVPLDFIFLALVESYWDKQALSYLGAYGAWQFILETGKDFGLVECCEHGKIIRDDRPDVEKSTRAACRYLKYLFEKTKGNEFGITDSDRWIWAFSAYNHGEGKIFGSGDKQGYFKDSKGDPENFFNFCEFEEAREYAPKILGLRKALEEVVF